METTNTQETWRFELADVEVASDAGRLDLRELGVMLWQLHRQTVLTELEGAKAQPRTARSSIRLTKAKQVLTLLSWPGMTFMVAAGYEQDRVARLLPQAISAAEALWLTLCWQDDPGVLDELHMWCASVQVDDVLPYHWLWGRSLRPGLTPLGRPAAPLASAVLTADRSGWPYEPHKATVLIKLSWENALKQSIDSATSHYSTLLEEE